MPSVIVWDDILLHPEEYIRRDFGLLIGTVARSIYRGPIIGMEEDEDDQGQQSVIFELAFCAYFAGDRKWHKSAGTKPPFPKEGVSLTRMEDGQINLISRLVRVAGIIYPKGDNLSARDVIDFDPLN